MPVIVPLSFFSRYPFVSRMSSSTSLDESKLPADTPVHKPKVVRKRKVPVEESKEEKKETEVKPKVKRVKKVKTEETKAAEPPVSAKKLRAKRQTKKNPMNQIDSIEPPPQNEEDNEVLTKKYNIKIYCLEPEGNEEDEQEEEFILQSIFDHIDAADLAETDEDEFY